MPALFQKGHRRFDLPPDAEKHLVWYGFLKRLPTTIFWASLGYIAGFALLTLALGMTGADPVGAYRENTPRYGVKVSHSLREWLKDAVHPALAKLL